LVSCSPLSPRRCAFFLTLRRRKALELRRHNGEPLRLGILEHVGQKGGEGWHFLGVAGDQEILSIYLSTYLPIYLYIYICMVVDQNSLVRKRPFFANKHVTFAKFSLTPLLSFARPMLRNIASYEDSFTTCQITVCVSGSKEVHGAPFLLGHEKPIVSSHAM